MQTYDLRFYATQHRKPDPIKLIYAAKDEKYNNAVALRSIVESGA